MLSTSCLPSGRIHDPQSSIYYRLSNRCMSRTSPTSLSLCPPLCPPCPCYAHSCDLLLTTYLCNRLSRLAVIHSDNQGVLPIIPLAFGNFSLYSLCFWLLMFDTIPSVVASSTLTDPSNTSFSPAFQAIRILRAKCQTCFWFTSSSLWNFNDAIPFKFVVTR